MKPRNTSLFYLALTIGLIGVWLFTLTMYWTATGVHNPNYCCGANIGAGFIGMLSWFLGIIFVALLVASFMVKPKDKL